MNKKAENFQKYVEEKDPKAFVVDELKDEQFHTVVFRSFAEVQGNRLPLIVVLDDSIYGIIRLLVAPKALHDNNEATLLKQLNEYNRKYKSFKYYLDEEGNVVLDTCLLLKDDDAVDGDMIYTMFNVLIQHLDEAYKELMQTIWA